MDVRPKLIAKPKAGMRPLPPPKPPPRPSGEAVEQARQALDAAQQQQETEERDLAARERELATERKELEARHTRELRVLAGKLNAAQEDYQARLAEWEAQASKQD